MKNYIFCLLFTIGSIHFCEAQIIKPAKFTFTTSSVKAKVGTTIDLIFTAIIDNEWKLYGTDNLLNPGPVAAQATFVENDGYVLVGKLKAIKPIVHFDSYWKGTVSYFTQKAVFIQKVKVLKDKPQIEGKLKYQTCTVKDGSCVMGKDKFTFGL